MEQSGTALNIDQDSLDLEWLAIYNDGTILEQQYHEGEYNQETQRYSLEHHIGDIDQSKLVALAFTNKKTDNNRSYSVNLLTGEFNLNGIIFNSLVPCPPQNIKGRELIMFRRTRQDYTPDRGIIITNSYVIGYTIKYIHGGTQEEEERKFMIMINSDGTYSMLQTK